LPLFFLFFGHFEPFFNIFCEGLIAKFHGFLPLRLARRIGYDRGMLPELGRIGPVVLRSYSVMMSMVFAIGLGALAWHGWREEDRHTRWLDAGLVTIAAGLIGGRLEHVLIHGLYFAEHPEQILQVWLGGLEWHLAVGFGLGALAWVCRRWKIDFREVAGVLALIAPLGAALIFGGCWLAGCGYGQEVASLADYPPGVAAELPDMFGIVAPRLNSQLFGVAASLVVLGFSYFLARTVKVGSARLWITLALIGALAFALGATRGDEALMIGPLRLDQVLDLFVAAGSLFGAYLSLKPPLPKTATKG
jgi:prolipoprotein diacylglyceryltransferase